MIVKPWGLIDWLIPKFGTIKWQSILCASFEQRSTALSAWIEKNNYSTHLHYVIKVDDPKSEYTQEIKKLTTVNENYMCSKLGNNSVHCFDLLGEPGKLNEFCKEVASEEVSLMLDISAMPKRVFLFLTKQLLASDNVKDLVVCYTSAEHYPEGNITEAALPPAAIPGFSRETDSYDNASVIVSVGYMAFNLGELIEKAKVNSLKVLFPFPPGSPAYRRNWRLLNELVPDIPIQSDIKRIHAMDLFAAHEWIEGLISSDASQEFNMIPLGPKPHALAMGLAHSKMSGRGEIIYSQPQAYNPQYSIGIKKSRDGKAHISAYCLKKDHKTYI